MLRLIGEHGITTFCAPPTVYRALVLLDLAAYRLVAAAPLHLGAGEPLNPEVIEAWREATGLTIYDGYGQTETVNLLRQLPLPGGRAPARWASPRPASTWR